MKRFKNILVSVDTKSDDHPALQWARPLAEHNQASLTLVDVQREPGWPMQLMLRDSDYVKELEIEHKSEQLRSLAEPLRERGLEVSTKVLMGKTSIEIMREVLLSQHDLVVRVTRGAHSRRSGFLGSTSMRLLRKCPCAVWLVKPHTAPRFLRVLAAVEPTPRDGDHAQLNNSIIELATSIAAYEKGQLHVVHVWELFGASVLQARMRPEEYQDLEKTTESVVVTAFDKFLIPYGLNIRSENVHLVQGDPGRVIPELLKEDIDLIVMGTVARTGIPGMIMGNTAEAVLDRVKCAVLAIKPDGFISPVTVEK